MVQHGHRRRADAPALLERRPSFPPSCQYALFLRSQDELSFESMTPAERDEALDLLDPEQQYRLYDRGLSRRLAPLLGATSAG